MTSTTYQDRMRQKLTAALSPILLEIKDDSARHAGHAGHLPAPKISANGAPGPSEASAKEGGPHGETHFLLKIVSDQFEGLNALARHRLVYGIVAEELKERVHALVLTTKTPSEVN